MQASWRLAPYLPNSRVEDNKRYKYIRDMIDQNPFTFHRKKNAFSLFDKNHFKIIDNDVDKNEKNSNEINKNFSLNNNDLETLIFQKDHDKYMNLYNNFMKRKTSKIEENAQNYLKFLVKFKKSFQINNILTSSQNTTNNNSISNTYINKSSIFYNFNNHTIPISNQFRVRKHFLLGKKSPSEVNIFSPRNSNDSIIEYDKDNFIAGNIKTKNSDITNPFFYNGVAKEIIKLNQETMDYNKRESENKYKQKKSNQRHLNNDITLSPEKIHNPNYYNIGESSLEINPIINKGHYSISYSRNYNSFNKQKSDFY